MRAIGREDLLDDPRMVDGPTRFENQAAVGSPVAGGDLAELLTGRVRGRREPDDIVLVELLGARELNPLLAHRICDGATRNGLGERTDNPQAMYLCDTYTIPSNLAGDPGISVPFGTGAGGLPVGVQILAPTLGEATMFRVAQALEDAAP